MRFPQPQRSAYARREHSSGNLLHRPLSDLWGFGAWVVCLYRRFYPSPNSKSQWTPASDARWAWPGPRLAHLDAGSFSSAPTASRTA